MRLYTITVKGLEKFNMTSKRFQFNKADLTYTLKRAVIFLFPLALIYIPFVIADIEADGFQLADFGLNDIEVGALVLYVLNRLTTIIQLFLAEKK